MLWSIGSRARHQMRWSGPCLLTVFVVLTTSAAHAQYRGDFANESLLMVPRTRVPEDAGREREAERRYQDTLKKTATPARKPSNDPWRSVRPVAVTPPDPHKLQ